MPTVTTIIPALNYVHDTISNASTGLNNEVTAIGTANSVTMKTIPTDHFFKSDKQVVQQFPCCFTKAESEDGTPETSSQFQHEFIITVEIFDADEDEDVLNLRLMVWSQGLQQILNDITARTAWDNNIIEVTNVTVDYDPEFVAANKHVFLRHVVIQYTVLSNYGNFIS